MAIMHVALVAALAGSPVQGQTAVNDSDSTHLMLDPVFAEAGWFYSGIDIDIAAEVDSDLQVAVLLTGPAIDLHFGKKEKVWGVFWAPTGNVTFDSLPSVYHLRTSGEPEALASTSLLEELGLGYETLRHAVVNPEDEDLLQDLVHLKESEGLFSYETDGVQYAATSTTGVARVSVTVHLPANAPPATYSVQMFGFRDGALRVHEQSSFELRRAGGTQFLSNLAQTRGVLYGVLAVLMAVGAGLLVGFVFGAGKRAH